MQTITMDRLCYFTPLFVKNFWLTYDALDIPFVVKSKHYQNTRLFATEFSIFSNVMKTSIPSKLQIIEELWVVDFVITTVIATIVIGIEMDKLV